MNLRNLTRIPAILAGLFALSFGTPAFASEQVSLEGAVQVERTEVVDGVSQTVLAAPEDVVPGDRLVFSTSYRNAGNEAVENFVVTNPLPAPVVLAESSDAFVVSVDGGQHYGPLAQLTVTDEQNGERAALPSDVTHVRWILARLEPGASGSLTYNAFVR